MKQISYKFRRSKRWWIRVGKFIVKKPTGELFEVNPGNINVSLRAEQKLNVDAAVRATVGVVDGVLKNIQKAFVAEISSHAYFIPRQDVDELKMLMQINACIVLCIEESNQVKLHVWLLCGRNHTVKSELKSWLNIFILFYRKVSIGGLTK